MKEKCLIILTVLLLFAFASCRQEKKKFVIGVSQCSDDIWRNKLNDELRMATYFNEDIEVVFASAYDSDSIQLRQIDAFLDRGIDLLIVAPNQVATITPAIDKVYDSGIPVIVFDRKTSSHKYTAFIGADNHEMGRSMGEFIGRSMKGQGRVLEIKGLSGSSPSIDRHNGFVDGLSKYPGVTLVSSLQGDWTEESAYEAVKNSDIDLSTIDFVFGQNDRMALGARKAIMEKVGASAKTRYCGIDALPGKGGGMECVIDSILEASFIYPTNGSQVMQLAVNILKNKPYEKENKLMAAIVTRDNANILQMEYDEIAKQAENLGLLRTKVDNTLKLLSNQKNYMFILIAVIVLIVIVSVLGYLVLLQRSRIREEREEMARQQVDFYTNASHQLRTPLTLLVGPVERLKKTLSSENPSKEVTTLVDIVDKNTRNLEAVVDYMLKGKDDEMGKNAIVVGDADVAKMSLENTGGSVSDVSNVSSDSNVVDSENDTRVLIVDDNDDIRTFLRTILSDRYIVDEAANGQEGLAMAEAQVPDLIISDVMMPVMNGLEFCQRVKGETTTSHIPVLLLTARALSHHQIEGYKHGADAYITKPFNQDLLMARIENLLRNRHLLHNIWSTKDETPELQPVENKKENAFVERFKQIVEQRMSDSDLDVETIASEMSLSRVQLYRKLKALTGSSPVELLRRARLLKGKTLLETTDMSISEVAYEVGFSAPSYFTKCFKDEFGVVPGNLRDS